MAGVLLMCTDDARVAHVQILEIYVSTSCSDAATCMLTESWVVDTVICASAVELVVDQRAGARGVREGGLVHPCEKAQCKTSGTAYRICAFCLAERVLGCQGRAQLPRRRSLPQLHVLQSTCAERGSFPADNCLPCVPTTARSSPSASASWCSALSD